MSGSIVILDGSMGQELETAGAPFRRPEWSALALMEGPDHVRRAHDAYVAAGAEILTTNAYALVPYHIGEARFAADAARLAALAGRLAREAADAAGEGRVRVAGCLPPLFGSYRPDLFDPARAPELLAVLIGAQAPYVDLWLAETMGSIAEVEAVRTALKDDGRPLWLAFTLKDDHPDLADPRLRSHETVDDAVRAAVRLGAGAVLFNCSQPEVMGAAVSLACQTLRDLGGDLPVGVYANAYVPMTDDTESNTDTAILRPELDPPAYLDFARGWVRRGATIIGGCCGIGPEHVAALRRAFG
ncbi:MULTISPECIES: homocysteine S-methyltransferase family protein [Microbaculum]|uniref:Homocysteine S-methyltransferase family protein n=1 Tax=Microbaculum marinisediminis TaxID=2931392 RepID=A0AAW5QV11_9HYPH|nr:homocysteine S-methyltransferase family protein [Microbaculum sp. A6E488]MCT8970493.1 homocysteine S-methyltransferase family protein [Microbaculum sp. A6E488]